MAGVGGGKCVGDIALGSLYRVHRAVFIAGNVSGLLG